MNTVTILGCNYEGALFRGIFSPTDQRLLTITITSENERTLCDWILYEFSYGNGDEGGINTLDELVEGYETNNIPNFDGCGGIDRMIINGKVCFETHDEIDEDIKGEPMLELGTIDLDEEEPNLNMLVEDAVTPEDAEARREEHNKYMDELQQMLASLNK